ncbi:MAG: glycosyltransferase [Phycisphaerales bacterium]
MRILQVSPLSRGGGAERAAVTLTTLLKERGHEVRLLCARRLPGDPPSVRPVRFPGEKYLRLVEKVTGPVDWRYPGSRWKLARIQPSDWDVVHLHNLHGGWISLRAVQQLSMRIPTVWSFHDEWPITFGLPYDLSRYMTIAEINRRYGTRRSLYPGASDTNAWHELIRRWMPCPQAIICHSTYMVELAKSCPHWRDVPTHLVYLPAATLSQPERFLPRDLAKRSVGLNPDDRVIGLVAAQLNSTYKGIPLAIEALSSGDFAGAKLLIVGNQGPAIAAKVPLPATCLGYVTDKAKLAAAFRAMDVLLVPSVAESFGLVAIEALACRTPIVCFAIGGLTDIVGRNERGLLATPFDTQELARHLERFLADPALADAAGQRGEKWVASQCTFEDYVGKTIGIYQHVI